jgi:hypothetical protein
MENDKRILELYEELKREFQLIEIRKYPIVILKYYFKDITAVMVQLSKHIEIPFFKIFRDYTLPYDIVRNFYLLNDFLTFYGFEQEIQGREHIFFTLKNMFAHKISIKVDIYEIGLSIYGEEYCDDIHKCFDKIYDLIDYLKDYFDLQNKVAIRE